MSGERAGAERAAALIVVSPADSGIRLDRWFRRHYPEVPHAVVERWLRTGQVRLDGARVRSATRIIAGQQIRVPPHAARATAVRQPRRRAIPAGELEALRDRILFADDFLLVIDKPAGLAVQGGTKTQHHLDAMLDGLSLGGERPRLVHRLDRDTSGTLVLARTAAAAATLARAFREHRVEKQYWAIVVGVPERSEGRIDQPLAKRAGASGERVETVVREGERAITDYRVVERAGRRAAWLELRPLTGRTHQLRVHCLHLGTPILGDRKYGGNHARLPGADVGEGLHLHARSIRIPLAERGDLRVTAPLPAHMRVTWRFFGFAEPPLGAPGEA